MGNLTKLWLVIIISIVAIVGTYFLFEEIQTWDLEAISKSGVFVGCTALVFLIYRLLTKWIAKK